MVNEGLRANPCSDCDNVCVAWQQIGMHSWNEDKMIANQIPHESEGKISKIILNQQIA